MYASIIKRLCIHKIVILLAYYFDNNMIKYKYSSQIEKIIMEWNDEKIAKYVSM